MSRPLIFRAMLAAALLVSAILPALPGRAAEPPVSVHVNMARVLRINQPASTVIIGNPAVADVTIQDPRTLILTGKSYGRTNLIVLDAGGNPIADAMLEVVQAQPDTVTVYFGAARSTYSCTPSCQPSIMLGDDPSFTTNSISSKQLVDTAAQ